MLSLLVGDSSKVVAYDAALNQGSDTSNNTFTITLRPDVPALSPFGVLALFLMIAVVAVVSIRRALGMKNG
jgi:hypothetical protein